MMERKYKNHFCQGEKVWKGICAECQEDKKTFRKHLEESGILKTIDDVIKEWEETPDEKKKILTAIGEEIRYLKIREKELEKENKELKKRFKEIDKIKEIDKKLDFFDKEVLTCQICYKEFNNISGLRNHIRVHRRNLEEKS